MAGRIRCGDALLSLCQPSRRRNSLSSSRLFSAVLQSGI